jgi:MFS family permease
MAGPRPGSERSTHTAWSLTPNDRGGILLWLVKWVAAAILAGAGIWGGVTWAIILRETEWRWIPAAIAIEAVIVAGAIVTPKLRPKMLLVVGVAVFMTASAVAYLLPRRWCFGYSWTGGPPYDCHEFPLWGRILVVGVGLVVGLMLASFARGKPDRVARRPFNP